ncbi:helix-turn-helix domain-containing protein [Mucilaginibacter lacusdianchii]|uniref:helix-turn-helix domain-containing protein n=1 Tax=Mucilaginibacter lacusdianchii TaxID=2684211 RepID=UPI00131E6C9F|nr:helix-turn-helix domain-containing protein [Mucilaginibacter sp. JXJ CY 39]
MESFTNTKSPLIGKKIERVRKLRGLTQEEVGQGLGMSKQAFSKLEQSESIEDERLQQIANVLGVTLEGLKKFNEESILHNTNNFYEAVNNSSVNNGYECTTVINNPIERIIELYESLLKSEREKVQILLEKTKR